MHILTILEGFAKGVRVNWKDLRQDVNGLSLYLER